MLVIDDVSANLPAPGSADLTQNSGPQVTALVCSPTSLMSGASSTCQVTLNQNAPSGGASVALASSNSSAVSVPAVGNGRLRNINKHVCCNGRDVSTPANFHA